MAATKKFSLIYTNNSIATSIYDSTVHGLSLLSLNTNVKIGGYVMRTGNTTAKSCVTVTGNGICDTIEKEILGLDFSLQESIELDAEASFGGDNLFVAKSGYGYKMKAST